MARGKPQYLLEEPITGLYITGTLDAPRLSARAADAALSSRQSAFLESNARALAGQPHELVRLDA